MLRPIGRLLLGARSYPAKHLRVGQAIGKAWRAVTAPPLRQFHPCLFGATGQRNSPVPRRLPVRIRQEAHNGRCSDGMGTVTLNHGVAGSIPARSACTTPPS